MIEIETSRGLVARIDDEDGDLAQYHWYINTSGKTDYAMTHGIKRENGKPSYLHRVIADRIAVLLNVSCEGVVVFDDGCSLNCCRGNLVLCTHADAIRMQGLTKRNTSGFKGVSELSNGKYRAYICADGHRIHLGTFTSAEDAASEYDYWAKFYFGEFARTNLP